jgi:hypothetical protein
MSHQAKVIKVIEAGDGLLAVHARCCGDSSTESVLTVHELHRDDAEIDADIASHLQRIEKLHDARDRAKAHIERLCLKSQ